MLVYRLCKREEINTIFGSNSFNEVGEACKSNFNHNHEYIPNKKYIHFFKKKENILFLETSTGMCVCTYDIPEELLSQYKGTARYPDYTEFQEFRMVVDYAIPCELMKYEYLKKVDVLKHKIDFEDFMDDYDLSYVTNNIYCKEEPKKLIKRK